MFWGMVRSFFVGQQLFEHPADGFHPFLFTFPLGSSFQVHLVVMTGTIVVSMSTASATRGPRRTWRLNGLGAFAVAAPHGQVEACGMWNLESHRMRSNMELERV